MSPRARLSSSPPECIPSQPALGTGFSSAKAYQLANTAISLLINTPPPTHMYCNDPMRPKEQGTPSEWVAGTVNFMEAEASYQDHTAGVNHSHYVYFTEL